VEGRGSSFLVLGAAFDAIPHMIYGFSFARWKSEWAADCTANDDRATFDALPLVGIHVYRGQDQSASVGLSWTSDRKVAEGFARGHRGMYNPKPVILERVIGKKDIAFTQTDREEAEVVLFSATAGVEFIPENGDARGRD
jgi:hypothetical protein